MKVSLSSRLLCFCLLALSVVALAGCGASFTPAPPVTTVQTPLGTISGSAYGGRQPIIGAQIYVYAAGTTAYGGSGIAAGSGNASTSLLNSSVPAVCGSGSSPCIDGNGHYYVLTDANGYFTLTGEYTCTPGTQIYLYSVGGNPGAGTNTSGSLMAVLGQCPASGTMAALTPHVYMSEASTVAAAYALAGFASDATHVSSSGTALAQTGIANAFANAAQMYNIASPPNPNIQTGSGALANTPGSGTNGGTGTVPQQELNSLANILAACVNSVGSSSPACTTLFEDATNDGVTCSSPPCADQPAETASAAINIAHFPGTNVTALYNVVGTTAVPYSPALGAAPANWTVALAFTGGGLVGSPSGEGIAIDGSGNAWVVGYSSTVLSEFSPFGVPANTSGYALGLNGPDSVAIDITSSNVWVANFGSSANSLTDFTISGATSVNYPTGSSTSPVEVALDGSGNVWTSAYGNNTVLAMSASTGSIFETLSGNGLSHPTTIAFQAGTGSNVWVANEGASDASVFTSAGGNYADDTSGGVTASVGTAIDAGGNVWIANTSAGTVSRLSSSGSGGSSTTLGSGSPYLIFLAVDGAGNVWVNDITENTFYELNNAGTNISGTAGYATVTGAGRLALDGSGNIWYPSSTSATLYEVIGAATPVVTPLAYGVRFSMLGTRP